MTKLRVGGKKQCCGCGEWKLEDEENFYFNKKGCFYASPCRTCKSEYLKERKRNMSEEERKESKIKARLYSKEHPRKEAVRMYYEKNKDRILKRRLKWANEHRDRLRRYYKFYYEKNKDRVRCSRKKYNDKLGKEEVSKRQSIYYKRWEQKKISQKTNKRPG